jgi:hypothetical protein
VRSKNLELKKIHFLFLIFYFLFFFLVFLETAFAEVIVFDNATTTGKAIKLKALTKGKIFPEGGKLIEFYVEEKHIGTTLSGGDGYAFMKYLSLAPGIKNLKVKANTETDEGVLLVTEKNDKVLLIEIENTLFVSEPGNLFQLLNAIRKELSSRVKEGKDALQQLSKRFRIIYLTTMIGTKESRKWLKDNEFPISAILKWEGTDLLDELKRRGLRLYAIVASPDVLSEASGIEKRFSFEETEDGAVVDNWKDLLKQLK